ncbi:MAG: HD domain-containing protein [Methylobacterium sp.]|nr:HD domain-containing protein [Methylobacterium sp.]MCA4921979.1 HD domain-containing protein [Methylobacterium sp.]
MAERPKAYQRIRDPLHDLVEFFDTELDRALWDVVQTRPFQRLRRVKQLGFSDLVYPGATHSRFAHSIGVFHTARQLMGVVRRYKNEPIVENKALTAALVHDLGHGPFSHAFEKVGKRLSLKLADHENMSDLLIRDSEVSDVLLKKIGRGFADDVADIIKKDGVKQIQHAVVSSQFDADRLDYMRRDRLMSGTQHSAIDFTWLIANLEVARVPYGVDDQPLGEIETFVLGPKAIHAAEAFVLGLFQLYPTVYMHKATRGAELLFTELLVRVVELVRSGDARNTGLPKAHPLVVFARNPEKRDVALALDDSVVWGALSLMAGASDELIKDFSARIRDRKLWKCIDIRTIVSSKFDPTGSILKENPDKIKELSEKIDKCCISIYEKLTEWDKAERKNRPRVLMDRDSRTPYKPVGVSKGPLDRINVQTNSGDLVDLNDRSNVVAALKVFELFRSYVAREDAEAETSVQKIVEGEIKACLQ